MGAITLDDGVMVGPGLLQVGGEFVDRAGRAGPRDQDAASCGSDSGEEENDSFHARLHDAKLTSPCWMHSWAQWCSRMALDS